MALSAKLLTNEALNKTIKSDFKSDAGINQEPFDENSSISQHKGRRLAATSAALSIITTKFLASPDTMNVVVGMTYTVKVQAKDVNNMSQTTGGDIFQLRVENLCTVSTHYTCDLVAPSQNLSGLPIIKTMTDNGDGTYTADYLVSQTGSVSVSVELLRVGGINEYTYNGQAFPSSSSTAMNYSLFSSAPARFQIVPQINYDWGGSGLVTPTQNDDVSGVWEGKVFAPVTGTFTFYCWYDDQCFVYVAGELVTYGSCCGWISGTKYLTAGAFYDIRVIFAQGIGAAFLRLDWSYPGVGQHLIPSSSFYYPERVGGNVKTVLVESNAVTFTLADIHIELTVPKTVDYSGSWPSIPSAISLSSTDTDFLSFSGYVLTVSTSDSTKNSGLINGFPHTRMVIARVESTAVTAQTTLKIYVHGCDTHNMILFTINLITVEMSYIEVRTLPVAHDQNAFVPTLNCPMTLSTPDGPNFISFTGYQMTVTTVDATLVGTQVRKVIVTKSGVGIVEYLEIPVTIQIIARCHLSALQQLSQPDDMSTPIFGNVFQDLAPLFTHEHADIWPVGTCVISFYIKGGDTTYLECQSTSDPVVKTTLNLYPYIFSDEGTYATKVVAYYGKYTDQVKPTQELEIPSSFQVTVEPECKITSFLNDPTVSQTLEKNYIINTAAVYFPFDIRYEPNTCNYIKTYVFTVDGVAASPAWLSVDSSSEPHKIKILSNSVSHEGTFTIGISASTNTIPKYVSSDQYIFLVSLSFDICSSIIFDPKTLTTMNFRIASGTPATSASFFTHSNSGGKFECGPRQYRLVSTYAGLTFEGKSGLTYNVVVNKNSAGYSQGDELKFSFQTTDPGAVGTHKIELMVETLNYPLFNSVLYRIDNFDLIVTASCWDTVMQYTPPSSKTQIVRQPAVTYQIPDNLIKDTVSTTSAPYDGSTYCGARNYFYVKVTSTENASPDSSWLSFDGVDTFYIQPTEESQWGHYQVFFGIQLELYPDFVMQKFSFQQEIVPACAESLIIQLKDIVFKALNRNQISTVDFAGFFTHTMDLKYNNYCGSLIYFINPSDPAQIYLKYDGASLLTFAPLMTHAAGIFIVNLQVKLAQYLNVALTVPIQLEIIACDIEGHYADTVNGDAIIPARQTKSTDTIVYTISQDLITTFDFTFNDLKVTQNNGCEAAYSKQYYLYLAGVDVSSSLPNWITSFNPTTSKFAVFSTDPNDQGIYALTVKSVLLMSPTNRMAETQIVFNFKLIIDPCLYTKLQAVTIQSMEFKIKSGMVPITQVFPEVISNVKDCGPIIYSLTGVYPSGALTLDSVTRRLTLWTQTGQDVGTYKVKVHADLQNYPILTQTIGIAIQFIVKIDSDCLNTELFPVKLSPAYYMDGSAPTAVQLLVKDLVSTYNRGDGYTLCGPRVYNLSHNLFHSITPNKGGIVQIKLFMKVNRRLEGSHKLHRRALQKISNFNDFLGSYAGLHFDSAISENKFIKVTITVSLEQYPSVAPVSMDLKTFFLKRCYFQAIGSVTKEKEDYVFMNGVGQPKRLNTMQPYFVELDYLFIMNGAQDLFDQKICGTPAMNIYYYHNDNNVFEYKNGANDIFKIDKETKLPEFLGWSWVNVAGFDTPQILLQTDDVNDVGEYRFIACFYLAGYDPAFFGIDAETVGLLRPKTPFKVKIASNNEVLANNPPVVKQRPSCENIIVRVSEDEFPSPQDFQGPYFVTAIENDPGQELIADVEWLQFSVGYKITDCMPCIGKKYFGDGGHYYKTGTEYGIGYVFSGLPKWAWHYQVFNVFFSDGLKLVKVLVTVSFVPHDFIIPSGQCMSKDEIQALRPDANNSTVEIKNEIYTDTTAPVVKPDKEVSIEIAVIDAVPTFDIAQFLSTYSQMFSQGADFSENGPNYKWAMKELQKIPHPFPLVTKFTYTGQVNIRFSREIYLPAKQELGIFVEQLVKETWLELKLTQRDNFNVVYGKGYYEQSYFNETYSRRLLKGSVDGTGKISEIVVDNKNFRWTVSLLETTRMHLQITFEDPSQISHDIFDKMQIQFKVPEKLLIGIGGAAPSELEIKQSVTIPRQLDEEKVQAMKSASSSISRTMQVASIGNIVLAGLTSSSLQSVWGSISALQLTSHMPLNNINFPEVVQIMFEELIKVVTFDVLQALEQFGFKLEYDVSPTLPYNDGFNTLGYSTSEPIALLGSINFMLAFIVVQIVWLFTPRRFCCKQCKQRQQADVFSNSLIRFAIQTTFSLIICSGAVLYPRENPRLLDQEEKTEVDKILIGYTAFISSIAFAFLVFTCFVTLFCTRKSVILSREIRKRENQPLTNEVKKVLNKKKRAQNESNITFGIDKDGIAPPLIPLSQLEIIKDQNKMRLVQLKADLKKETDKKKYFNELFVGITPQSHIAQYFYLVFLVRRSLLVFIALQFDHLPGLQIIAIVLISLMNQVYLLSGRLFENRKLYNIEVLNDFTVYIASILALSLTATIVDEAQNALGVTLVCIVVLNLVMNMVVIFGGMCCDLKKNLALCLQKAQNWDIANNPKFQCKCQCYSCGGIAAKSTEFTCKRTKKALKSTRAPISNFQLKLYQCERLTDVNDRPKQLVNLQENMILPTQEKNLKSQKLDIGLQNSRRQRQRINTKIELKSEQEDEFDFDKMLKELSLEDILQILKNSDLSTNQQILPDDTEKNSHGLQPAKEDASVDLVKDSQLLDMDFSHMTSEIESESDSESESESEQKESLEEEKIGTNKQMRYRHWVVEHSDNFDQVVESPVAIKKLRDPLDELVSGPEQMAFVSISQDSPDESSVQVQFQKKVKDVQNLVKIFLSDMEKEQSQEKSYMLGQRLGFERTQVERRQSNIALHAKTCKDKRAWKL